MTALVCTQGSITEPITTTEAKSHLRVTTSTDDTLIAIQAMAARIMAEEFLQRRMVSQTWELYLDSFPCERVISMPYPPLISVQSVNYKDPTSGSYVAWDSANYVVDTESEPGRIARAADVTAWPQIQVNSVNGVKIAFTCGYANAAAVPANIIAAIKLYLGDLYENRENSVVGTIVAKSNTTAELLMSPYRMHIF